MNSTVIGSLRSSRNRRSWGPWLIGAGFVTAVVLGGGVSFLLIKSQFDRLNERMVELQRDSERDVGRFYQMKKDASGHVSHGDTDVVLRVHGSNTLGDVLAPELARAFFVELGAHEPVRLIKNPMRSERILVLAQIPGQQRPQAIEVLAVGSSTAFEHLESKTAEIGLSSRQVSHAEVERLAEAGLPFLDDPEHEHVVGFDGLVLLVHPSNPVTTLDRSQIRDLFRGRISNWAQVGGAPGAVNLYVRDLQSGSHKTFNDLIMDNAPYANGARIGASHQEVADRVASDPMGIGYVSIPYIQGGKALAVHEPGQAPIFPTSFAVRSEDYLLTRRLYMYADGRRDQGNRLAREFLNFVHSDEGMSIVENVGFVALHVEEQNAGRPELDGDLPDAYRAIVLSSERLSMTFRFVRGPTIALDSRGVRDIDRLADLLRRDRQRVTKVWFVGFSNASGDPDADVSASLERARLVRSELLARGLDISPRLIEAIGFGAAKPVASNATPDGRHRNRRVEVWIQGQ